MHVNYQEGGTQESLVITSRSILEGDLGSVFWGFFSINTLAIICIKHVDFMLLLIA